MGEGRMPGRLAGQGQPRQVGEQRGQRRLQLDPGQRRAEAEVDAGAEAEVRVGGAAQVEPVRVGEHRRVPVGRAQQRGDLLARLDRDRPDPNRLGRGPLEQLQRRVVPDQLLDGARHQARVRAQPGQLAGVGEQRVGPVADDVDARLVPGHLQQHRGRDQLVLGQPAAVRVPGRDQVGEQVLARVPAPVRRSASRTYATYSAAAASAARRRSHRRRRLVQLHDRVRPRPQQPAVGVRHAEQRRRSPRTGSGSAYRGSRSTVDPSGAGVEDVRARSRAISVTRPRSRSTCRRPNPAATSRRSRVCVGGSFSSSECSCSSV